jgi:hypothetical protein
MMKKTKVSTAKEKQNGKRQDHPTSQVFSKGKGSRGCLVEEGSYQ